MVYVPCRQYTNKILEAVADGLLDRDQVILACLNRMTDRDVQLMAKANEFLEEDKEDDDVDKDDWIY